MRTSTPAFRSPRAARLSPLAAGIAVALAPVSALATTYPVSNTAEFIAAINSANSNCATDSAPLIQASGPFVVSTSTGMPSFGLPTLFCATNAFNPTIDGGGVVNASDTNGFTENLDLRGSGSFADCGLTFPQNFTYGGHLTVTGMKISNFTYGSLSGGVCGAFEIHNNLLMGNTVGARSIDSGNILGDSASGGNVVLGNDYGFWVSSASTIENNKIGTPNGTTANGNGYGIYVTSSNGPTIDNNLISGNSTAGVYFSNDYGGTTLSDNYIGTTADGDGALGNGDGVVISSSGNQSLDNNVISGNSGAGVSIDNASFVTFDSNYIGVGFSGSVLPNNRGVDAFCSGYIDLFDNTISSNNGDGVTFQSVDGSSLSSNIIMRNRTNGVRFTTNNVGCFNYGSFNSLFGNDIELNGANGILLTGLGTNNRFSYGTITANGNKNISLNGGGVPLPNDPGDFDGGPNDQQNYPDITAVVQGAGFTSIDFSVDSSPSNQYQVDFYANTAMGKPGGETYLGSAFVYGGTPSNYVYYGGAVNNVSATATLPYCCGPGGDTSEFSPMKAAITAPAVLVAPNKWNFGNVEVNTSSPTKTFTLGSQGDQPYIISDILPGSSCLSLQLKGAPAAAAALPSFCYGGGFTCSTTCQLDTPYAKNQTCTFTAQFSPFFFGVQTDSICIQDNTAASPHFIDLTGTGVPPPPLRIDPTTFDFGDIPVGATTDSMRFRVTNTTYGTMPVTVATSGGEFNVLTDSCSPSIPSLSNCDVFVNFSPTISGGQDGTLIVQGALLGDVKGANALLSVGPPQARATLGGNGISGGQLALPAAIDMGAAQVGGAAITYPVQLVNTGYGALSLASVTASSPFIVVNGCPATLAPQEACTLTLSFSAEALGEVSGTLTVVTSAEGGSRVIQVTARGQTVSSPLLRLQPSALGFGARVIGSSSAAQEIKVTNIGGAAANIALSSASIDFLISSSTCGTTLAAQDSCTANVSFRPLGFGTRLGQFVVTGNATNSPAVVGLSGTGCRPFAAGSSRFGSSLSCAP